MVNCAFNQGFEGVRWLERSHSYPYKPHITFQTSTVKDLRSDKKFPKIVRTCNFQLPKMESSSPQLYIIKKASNQIFPNMKVEYLALTFPKSLRTWISHEWLESYDQIIFTKSWTSKGHISQTIWPILVGFFPTNHISSPLSKNINFMYQKSMDQNGIFELDFIKIQVWTKVDFLN